LEAAHVFNYKSHKKHSLQTTLSSKQEIIAVQLRKTMLLPHVHRLTQRRTPQTNGMVGRFNWRIAEVLMATRFYSGEDLDHALLRYVREYNH